jgi:hypothetical protein
MRWIALLAFGTVGWVTASGGIEIKMALAPWLHGWLGWVFALVLVVCCVCLVPLVVILEPVCNIAGAWLERLSGDAERISKRYCGKPKGWIYQVFKWAAIIWFLPFVMTLGALLQAND